MLVKYLFRDLVLFIQFLLIFIFVGSTYAGTTNNDLNADLIKAAFSGNLPEVERLLENGANVNAKRDDGITALIGASIEGHEDVVALLLAKGVDVNEKGNIFGRNGGGATACDFASLKGHQEIVKMLIRAGAFHEQTVETYHYEKAKPPKTSEPTSRGRRD
ncbi:MAG: ankyrin repeat domain-containing protein [Pseudomonadota bacterium]